MRRRFATLAALVAVLVAPVVASRPAAAAAPVVHVDIVKVSGLIDPTNADLLLHSVADANHQHALLLVWQVNSTGGTISSARLTSIVTAMRDSTVPIATWVGGSASARAYGAAFSLVRASDYSGEAPGSRVGKGPGLSGTLSGDDAADRGLLDEGAPTLVDFLGDLSGKTLRGVPMALGEPRTGFNKNIQFDFSQLSIFPKLLHTAASPDVAFAMLVIALTLVVFELYTAGVGVAAGTGVVFGALSAYGLGVLPTHPWAVGLLILSILAFAIDVQAGAPRFWTGVGLAAYVGGALTLYDGQAVSLWVVIVTGVLLSLMMIGGMPAMIRTRFSTPTIGRQAMIGAMGVAMSGVAPEGTVEVNGAPWRARTNRATPIAAGAQVRVIAIDGLLLEVEPETGGAREAHH